MPVDRIHEVLAVQIRIIGLQNKPSEGNGKKRKLRDAVKEALAYFQKKFPDMVPMGSHMAEMLIARFHINADHFDALSLNFKSCLSDLGLSGGWRREIAPFHRSYHLDVRDIKSKPDRIGLWFYQLMATLEGGAQFLIHMRLWRGLEHIVPAYDMYKKCFSACDQFNRNLHDRNGLTGMVVEARWATVDTITSFPWPVPSKTQLLPTKYCRIRMFRRGVLWMCLEMADDFLYESI